METDQTNSPSNGNHYSHYHSDEWTFEDLLIVLRRGRWSIVISLLVALLAVGGYTYFATPVYEATASVLIDSKSKAGSFPVFDLSGSGLTTKITNELETLKSRSLAEAVAQSLREKNYLDAERQRPIRIIRNPEQTDGRLSPTDEIVKRLAKSVDFVPVKESDVIKLTVRSSDPDEAMLIANTYMRSYADRDLNTSRMKSRVVREFCRARCRRSTSSSTTPSTRCNPT